MVGPHIEPDCPVVGGGGLQIAPGRARVSQIRA